MAILDGIPQAVFNDDPLKIVGTPVIKSTILNEILKTYLQYQKWLSFLSLGFIQFF